jgi:hypothetical protein
MSKNSARVGQLEKPEDRTRAARNVALTAKRSKSLAVLSKIIRRKLGDMKARGRNRFQVSGVRN